MRSPAILAALGFACLAGCHSDPYSFDAIKSDLTPEMTATAETDEDVQRNIAVVWNQNLRGAMNDLGRTFYWDQPSSLSPFPIVHTSGQPE
ncbi:MAG: hypothetical protein U0575_09600 [Phycisphaerales bacterium]|jgi:hypothetical protein